MTGDAVLQRVLHTDDDIGVYSFQRVIALTTIAIKHDIAGDLSGATIIGHAERGAVRLTGARVSGQLDCSGATIGNDSGPALSADSLQVGQAMFLADGFTATGSGKGSHGALRPAGSPAASRVG